MVKVVDSSKPLSPESGLAAQKPSHQAPDALRPDGVHSSYFCSMAIFFWAQLWHGFYILLCTEIQVIASEGHCVVASSVYGFARMREMHTYVNKQQNDHLKRLGSFSVSSIVVTDHISSYLLWFSSWLLDGLVSLFINTVDWPNYGEELIVHIFSS